MKLMTMMSKDLASDLFIFMKDWGEEFLKNINHLYDVSEFVY